MRLLILCVFISPLFCNDLDRLPLTSSIYRRTDNYYIKLGYSPPFYSRPYSVQSIPEIIKTSDENLSEHRFLKGIFDLSLRMNIVNKNPDELLLSYWYNRWIEKDPLLNIGFVAGNNIFHIRSEYDLRLDFPYSFKEGLFLNIPTGDLWYQNFDFNFPTRGFIVLGVSELQLLIGRDKMHFGPGQKVGLFLSKESSFYNQLNLSYKSSNFKATFFTIALESYLTDDERDELDYFLNPDNGLVDLWRVKYEKDLDSQSKVLSGHRFEFKPVENLILSFNDMILFGGRLSNFEDMTPAMFYHNIYGENYSNVIIGFDSLWVPFPGYALYGEVIIDDIRNIHEDDLTVPTSVGYLLGVTYVIDGFNGDIRFSVEAAKVDEFAYRRWSPLQSFFNRRKVFSINGGRDIYDNSIGAFLGPGSDFVSFWADYDSKNFLSISVGWEYWKMSTSVNVHTQELINAYKQGSIGEYKYYNVIYLQSRYKLTSNLSLQLEDHIVISNTIFNYLNMGISYSL